MSLPAPQIPGKSSRGNPALGDIVRSVAVLGLIIVALFGVGQLITVTPKEAMPEVDYLLAASGVEAQTGFVPLVPAQAPGKATSARFTPTSWNIGFLTDKDDFVGLTQTTDSPQRVLDDIAPKAEKSGTKVINSVEWTVYTERGGDVTLVSEQTQTIAVTGSIGRAGLEKFAASLSPLAPKP